MAGGNMAANGNDGFIEGMKVGASVAGGIGAFVGGVVGGISDLFNRDKRKEEVYIDEKGSSVVYQCHYICFSHS
jgi:hypothetical protein